MNVFERLSKQPRLALIATAVAVLFAGNALPQDANRQSANQPSQSTQVARSDTGMQTLEQYLQNKTLRVSKLVGMEVQSRSGDNLGEVHDVARNAAPGQNLQLIVALGGIVGDDQKLIAIPFDGVEISADGDELHTNRTRDQLAGLPAVTLDAQTASRGSAQPSAAGESRSAAPASPAPAGTASLRERRVGDLLGIEVIGSAGDKVGEVDDIVLSTAGADSVRAVLQVGGVAGIGEKRISLPLNQLTVERAADAEPTLRVALDIETLERLPEFEYEDQTAVL
jgi:sporulation protein YlmC with PRC-barrel domain